MRCQSLFLESILKQTTMTEPQQSSLRSHTVSQRSQASTASSRTLSFFRKLVSHRTTDYRSDVAAAVVPPSSPAAALSGLSQQQQQHHDSLSRHNSDRPAGSFWERYVQPGGVRRWQLAILLQSRVWKGLLVFGAFVLLFGSHIQMLLLPKEADVAMDAVYMVFFAFFWLDILVRVDVEPNYFHCRWTSLGSFLFYCELVSTLALLHDISFVSRRNFDVERFWISLDAFGIPVGCFFVCALPWTPSHTQLLSDERSRSSQRSVTGRT